MNTNQQTDFANGNILKLLIKLSVPAITAQVINALYNIVDRMYIGHIADVGATALTGVGLTFPIILIISAFSSLVGMGGAPLASIAMGEGDKNKAERILGNGFVILILFSILLTGGFLIFKEDLLILFGASEQTLPYANDYIGIYVCGTLFVQLSLGLNAFINAQGYAKTGMMTVIIGAVTNIILDPILIFGFNMGVKGAALATIISQFVSAIWVLLFLVGQKSNLKIKVSNFKPNYNYIGKMLALGLSPFIMQSTESLVQIAFNVTLKPYGDMYIGTMTIMTSLMQVFFMPLMGITQGAQPIIGYNYGAGNYDRVKKTMRYSIASCTAFASLFWLIVMVFPQLLISMFNKSPEIMEIGIKGARIFFLSSIILGIQSSCQNSFIAIGKAKVSIMLALLRKIILLIPLVIILPRFFDGFGPFIAEPIADALATLTTLSIFIWHYKRIGKETKQIN